MATAEWEAIVAEYNNSYAKYEEDKEIYDSTIEEYRNHSSMVDFFNEHIRSLKDFGRNCTSLVSFNKTTKMIPRSVYGESCLENFLRGCTSFNQKLSYDSGSKIAKDCDKAFKYFLRGCTSFNSALMFVLPFNMEGESVFHGFLYGCTSFNNRVVGLVPNGLVGKAAMKRFLYGCESFNQDIKIPANLSGNQCLAEFMVGCRKFNKPFTLPDNVRETCVKDEIIYVEVNGVQQESFVGYRYWEMINFMKDCDEFCSTITVPAGTGAECDISEQTFSTLYKTKPLAAIGVTFDGPGADDFADKFTNNYQLSTRPYKHITNLDALYN